MGPPARLADTICHKPGFVEERERYSAAHARTLESFSHLDSPIHSAGVNIERDQQSDRTTTLPLE